MAEEMVLTHRWTEKGLGAAPFRCIGFFSFPSKSLAEANPEAYMNACRESAETMRALGVTSGGICDVCGMNLTNNYVIRSADNKRFVVGCDCVEHTGDSKLITAVEAHERKRKRVAAKVKREAKYAAERAKREESLRVHNAEHAEVVDACGYCARDAADRKAAWEHAERTAAAIAANAWLINVLNPIDNGSGFIHDMIERLHSAPLSTFSERQVSVLAEIYAKTVSGKRAGSDDWHKAHGDFYSKAEGA